MGKVIHMTDWKKRKAKPDPVGRGKTYTYNPNQDPSASHHDTVYEYEKERRISVRTTTDEQEEAFKSVKALLVKSIQADRGIYNRSTVQGRETAAIDSLGFHMEALEVAKKHGLTIRRRETGVGVPKVFEVIGFGQILIVK